MSETLYQQVNLYQPILRRQRHIFSALTMIQSLGVVTVALMTIYGYGVWQVGKLEAEAVQLEGRERAYGAQMARLDPSESISQRRAIEREIESLNASLIAQQRLIDVLNEQQLGSTDGFSVQLAALGRRYSSGLWLTELRINGSTESIELVGRSTDPAKVPAYLLRLGEEQALTGQRFDSFEIERFDDPESIGPSDIGFRVSSKAVAQ